MSTTPELGSLGNMADDLGSLAQSARTKQLKTARGILYVIGVLALVANGVAFFIADTIAGWQSTVKLKRCESGIKWPTLLPSRKLDLK